MVHGLIAKDPVDLFRSLKEKYSGIMNIYTSIVFDYRNKEIKICNDAGRLTRPVLRVSSGNKLIISNRVISDIRRGELKWQDLLTNIKLQDSVIEYIDPLEQNFSLISMTPRKLASKDRL